LLHYVTIHYITLHYITSHYITYHHAANLCIFGVTYITNNLQICMKYVIDAWTPVLHISLNIVCLLYNILTPLIYIILRPTGKFYNCQ